MTNFSNLIKYQYMVSVMIPTINQLHSYCHGAWVDKICESSSDFITTVEPLPLTKFTSCASGRTYEGRTLVYGRFDSYSTQMWTRERRTSNRSISGLGLFGLLHCVCSDSIYYLSPQVYILGSGFVLTGWNTQRIFISFDSNSSLYVHATDDRSDTYVRS